MHRDLAITTFSVDGRLSHVRHEVLLKDVITLSAYMSSLGIKQDNRLIICGRNCYEWIVLDLACLKLGVTTIPVHHDNPHEVDRLLTYGACAVAIDKTHDVLGSTRVMSFSELRSEAALGGTTSVLATHDWSAKSDVVTYKSTSGTTTQDRKYVPAGIEHIAGTLKVINAQFDFVSTEKILIFLPASIFLQRVLLYLSLQNGCHIIFCDREQAFINLLMQQPSVVFGVPLFFIELQSMMLRKEHLLRNHKPRILWSGSADCSTEVLAFFNSQGMTIYEGYGMTEIGLIAKNYPGCFRLGSAGKLMPNVTAYIGNDGEIMVKPKQGPLPKYDFSSERSFPIDKHGFIATGDLGYFDEEGFLHITGRTKDLIVMQNGDKFSPHAIERALSEACECLCIVEGTGRPYAVVIFFSDGAEPSRLQEAVRRTKRHFKLPSIKRVALLDIALPARNTLRTETGKLRRSVLLGAAQPYLEAIYGMRDWHAPPDVTFVGTV